MDQTTENARKLHDNALMAKALHDIAFIRDLYENSDNEADQEMVRHIDESMRQGIRLIYANIASIAG